MKLFKNKRGSELVEKIIMVAFSVAMGGALIIYTAGVINQSKESKINYVEVTPSTLADGKIPVIKAIKGLAMLKDGETLSLGLKMAKEIVESPNFYFKTYETSFEFRGTCTDLGDVDCAGTYNYALKYCFTSGTFQRSDGTGSYIGANFLNKPNFINAISYYVTNEKQAEWGISLPEK